MNVNYQKLLLIFRLQKAQNEINTLQDENTKLLKQLVELNRSIDSKILNEIQLNEKITNLKNDYQRLQRERDLYKEDNETIRQNSNQRIDLLTNENTLFKSQLQEIKLRQTTSQQEDSMKIKDLELELRQAKNEISLLQAKIQELDAQFIKNSIDAGKQLLVSQTQALPSLAAEMETLSKDELMEKLNREQEANARYRDYIGQIIARIMEKSPEILEVKPLQPNVKLTKSTSVHFSKY
jgi:Rab11 family-interacting protein 3/4